jgi:hypothetical protein
MPYLVPPELVETVTRGLLGAIDVEAGPTDEQLAILWSVVDHLWKRDDLRAAGLAPLAPEELSALVVDEGARRRFHLILVTLELSRHPFSAAQVERAEDYASALDLHGADLEICRDWIAAGAEVAMADWMRCFGALTAANDEPSLRRDRSGADDVWEAQDADVELMARIDEFEHLPKGTLGHSFVDFYVRNGITVPGSQSDMKMNAVAVSHDMNHVIAGYEPSGQGEIALGAFQMAMNDSEENLVQFLGNLLIHEAGVLDPGGFAPKSGSLMRPGAIELLGEAFDRGSRCTRDFSHADHFAMSAWSLDEVREEFGVVPVTVDFPGV